MWSSGVVRRKKQHAVADMVAHASATGEYADPWRSAPEVWQFFADEGEILAELQSEWRTALAGAVYVAIEQGAGDLTEDVLKAFNTVKQRHLATRLILEAHADHPAIESAMRKERSLLATFTIALAAA